MILAFTTRYGDYRVGFYLQIFVGAFWTLIAFMQLWINKFKFKGIYASDFIWLLKVYLVPHFVIHLYTLFLMMIGKVDWNYFTTNATVYIPTLLAIFSLYLFGVDAYKYNCISLLCSWCLSVIASTVLKGFAIFPHAVLQAYINPYDMTGGLTINYLELHDLVLAIGYILIFFIFTNAKLTRRNFFCLVMVFLVMGLGMKRVTILGLILVIIFNMVLKRFTENRKYKFCLVSGWMAFIICYLYIYILSKGDLFFEFIENFGINVMGRNYYFQAIMKYAEFTPSFLGIGRNVVTQLLNNELSYLKVGGVHSDIIKMYVENGFILFGIWLWYYLIHMTKAYKKKYGITEAILYFGLIIYTFTLYLTDNVEIYYICQIFSILIPATYALKQKKQI